MTELPPERRVWYGVGEPPFDLTPFREQVAARDADMLWDYVQEWVDEETGETHQGFWDAILYREKRCSDGKLYFQALTAFQTKPTRPEILLLLLDLLDQAWEQLLEKHGVKEA